MGIRFSGEPERVPRRAQRKQKRRQERNGVPILVGAVLMDGRQRRFEYDNDVDTDEDPFGFDLLLGGSDGKFGSATWWCSCRSRNCGRKSVSRWLGIL